MAKRIEIRCTEEELASWKSQAAADGRSLSAWVRRRLEARPIGKLERAMYEAVRNKSYLLETAEGVVEVPSLLSRKDSAASWARAVCSHKPFKRSDGLTVCEKCGVRL